MSETKIICFLSSSIAFLVCDDKSSKTTGFNKMQKKKEHLKTNQSSKIGQSFGVIKFEFCKLTFCVLKAFCICGL